MELDESIAQWGCYGTQTPVTGLYATLVPLVVYFVSGRWFVRGIAAGAVKG